MSFYPSTLASFSTKVDNVSTIYAVDVNGLQNEIVAIETALGLNPQGASATLVARLAPTISSTGTLLANTVGATQIVNNSVGSTQVASGSVHNYHLAPDAFSSISGAVLVNSTNITNPNFKNGNGYTFTVAGSNITLSGGPTGTAASSIKLVRISAHGITVVSGAVGVGTPFSFADLLPASPIDGTTSLTFTLKRLCVWLNVAPSGGTLVLSNYNNGNPGQAFAITTGTKSQVFSGLSSTFVTNDIFQIGTVGSNTYGAAGLSFSAEFSCVY